MGELQNQDSEKIITRDGEIHVLQTEVKRLGDKVKQLEHDLETFDLFQKRPVLTTEGIKTIGIYFVMALAVIGIFWL